MNYLTPIEPKCVTNNHLAMYHQPAYYEQLQNPSQDQAELETFGLNAESPVFPRLYFYATCIAGASMMCANRVGDGTHRVAINWAGGHSYAYSNKAMHGCYVNDVILSTLLLLRTKQRVLVIHMGKYIPTALEEYFGISNVSRVKLISVYPESQETQTIPELNVGNPSIRVPFSFENITNVSFREMVVNAVNASLR